MTRRVHVVEILGDVRTRVWAESPCVADEFCLWAKRWGWQVKEYQIPFSQLGPFDARENTRVRVLRAEYAYNT